MARAKKASPRGSSELEVEPKDQEEAAASGPCGFRSVRGHDLVIAQLQRSISQDRVPHAYLFSGPDGVGKAFAAAALAQALNCEREPGAGCGICPACDRLRREVHPDLIRVVSDGKSIKIEQVRSLEDRLAQGPHEGRALVVLFDEAERLTTAAANAMLKSLEEPRPRVHFVLVTAAPSRLPITVRSRCHHLRFGPLPEPVLAALLVEELGEDPPRAEAVARLAEGSAARARMLLGSPELPLWQTWCDRLIRLGEDRRPDVPLLVQSLLQEVDEPETVLRLLLPRLRDHVLLASGLDEGGTRLTQLDAESPEAARARRMSPLLARRRLAAIEEALRDLEMYVNKNLALERMVAQLRP
ncbi:MAG: DNA polymerase III subunit delta' [Polyangia bacterium]|jgi:DNA polymerase-3 subunit delta'|nr:DNA polymerase III subunit delta' [Polyangia bacterium]